MLSRLTEWGRSPILALIAVLILAVVLFAVFKAAYQPKVTHEEASAQAQSATTPTQSAPTPAATPTITPVRLPVPTHTPLPTIPPNPTETPRPPTPVPTPIPVSTITNWVLRQDPSGFTFSYPSGWDILEPTVSLLPTEPEPVVHIFMANFTFQRPGGKGGIPLGALKIDIYDPQIPPPAGGTAFVVGPLKYSGSLFTEDHSNSTELPKSLDRVISIYFTAGNRSWLVQGLFAPPTGIADQNVPAFYQIVGSLRYDK